ncbi:hypothetical protein T484DRAFT_1757946 [Baffinella frigidus]|nr:hypothetical protein T484DRAFT_1757946 [Cryptophyta sp. CCMP2293]
MGLDKRTCPITVAAVYDCEENVNIVFRFVEVCDKSVHGVKYVENVGDIIEEFLCMLDSAKVLTAYNGIQFDIPFIQQQFDVSEHRVREWVFKTYDILEFSRKVLQRTFPLNMLLQINGFDIKSGDGLQAVRFAAAGQWLELESYCADDARLTWEVAQLKRILLPEGRDFRIAKKADFDPKKCMCLYRGDLNEDKPGPAFSYGIEDISSP